MFYILMLDMLAEYKITRMSHQLFGLEDFKVCR